MKGDCAGKGFDTRNRCLRSVLDASTQVILYVDLWLYIDSFFSLLGFNGY